VTKTRFAYEKPVLFGLNGESVVGATECDTGNGFTEGGCQPGSCVIAVMCSSGVSTQACVGGATACEKTAKCFASCQSGGSLSSCKSGSVAGTLYYCSSTGANASFMCVPGTYATYTCTPTGGYAGGGAGC